jgi:hypothetical protein
LQNTALDLDGMLQKNMQVLKQRGKEQDVGVDRTRVRNKRKKLDQLPQKSISMPDL